MASMKSKSKPTNSVNTDIADEDGVLCLKGDLFWKWRALDSELRAAVAEMEQTKDRIAVEISKHPELAEMISRQAGLAGTVSIAKTSLLQVQEEIETRMGVKLKDCAFDDKTGRLYNLMDDGTRGDPVKTPKRRVRKAT